MLDEDECSGGGGKKANVAWTDFIGYTFELLLFLSASPNVRTLANGR
jgi:hypothetical protein